MFCSNCAKEFAEEDRFCSGCGSERYYRSQFGNRNDGVRLTRPRDNKRIAGVCAGVARYFDLDVTLVRIVWFVMVFVPPVPGIIAYIACWIAMPKDPAPVLSTASVPAE